MEFHKKIAVFDLDGTLWKENSHIHIIEQFYRTRWFSSFFMKVFAHFFPKEYLKLLNHYYKKIPLEYIKGYHLPFRKSAVSLFEQYKEKGFFMLIVSNAPEQIVKQAGERLGIGYLRTDAGEKYSVFSSMYKYEYLMVCTDNRTDLDLLEKADEKYIYASEKNRKFFEKHISGVEYMEV